MYQSSDPRINSADCGKCIHSVTKVFSKKTSNMELVRLRFIDKVIKDVEGYFDRGTFHILNALAIDGAL